MPSATRFALIVTGALVTAACGDTDRPAGAVRGAEAPSIDSTAETSDISAGGAWRFSAPLIGTQISSITVGTVSEERVGDRNGDAWRCPGDDPSGKCDEETRVPSTVVQDHVSVVAVSQTTFGPPVDECVISATRRVEQRGDDEPILARDLGFDAGDDVVCLVLERSGVAGIGLPVSEGRIDLARSYVSDTAESTDLAHSPLEEAFDGLLLEDAVAALAEIAETADASVTDEDAIGIVDSHRSG